MMEVRFFQYNNNITCEAIEKETSKDKQKYIKLKAIQVEHI
jgi:hypothetical protein